MEKLKMLVLIGSFRKGSLNRQLFEFVRELGRDHMAFDVADLEALPYFSEDVETDPPEAVKKFKEQITACDGALFITPEYNRSIPGILKNAIDWGSRPMGANSWSGKPAGVMGATPGAMGTFGAQNDLRQIMIQLNVAMLPSPQFYFSTTGNLKEGKLADSSAAFLRKFLDALAQWVEKFK
jgi:chromate reductase